MVRPSYTEALLTCQPEFASDDIRFYRDNGFRVSEIQEEVIRTVCRMDYSWGSHYNHRITIYPEVIEYYSMNSIPLYQKIFGIEENLLTLGESHGSDVLTLLSQSGEIYLYAEGGVGMYGGKNFEVFMGELLKDDKLPHKGSAFPELKRIS